MWQGIVDTLFPSRTKGRAGRRGPLFPYTMGCYHCAICGMTRQGKTWLLLQLLSNVPDFIAVYPGGVDEKAYAAISDDIFVEQPIPVIRKAIMERAAKGERIAVTVVPDMYGDVVHLADIAFKLGNIVFAIDEAHEYWKSSRIPDEIMRIARRGAGTGVKMIITSQRPKDMNLDVISQCDTFLVFKLFMDADVERVEEACRHKIAETLQNLQPREYICIKDGSMLACPAPRVRTGATITKE